MAPGKGCAAKKTSKVWLGQTRWVVALGREGKRCAQIDARKNPHTAAMVGKLQTEEGKAAYRRRKWIAKPPNGWISSVLGFRQFSLRGQHHLQATGSS